MHIRIKKITEDRYIYLETVYPVEGVIHSDIDLISLNDIVNVPDMFEFMRVNYNLDKACILKNIDGTYSIDFRLNIIKRNKIKQATDHMKRYINKYFSPLQQNRYFTFFSLHEKGVLTQAEQYIYNIELHGRPESIVWNNMKIVLQWFYDCIDIYNNNVDAINNETDVKKLADMNVRNISYPAYPGG